MRSTYPHAICTRTGGPLTWTCLGVRKKGGIYTVKCPDCEPKPPSLARRLDLHAEPFVSGQCRLWLGARTSSAAKGYGQLFWEGRMQLAHRLAYEEYVGPIPEGLNVLHSCDNPPCISHEHLFLGTPASNAADRDAKKRGATGERNGAAKLTEAQVLAIRADPRSLRKVGAAYGVDQRTVSRIKRREGWGCVKEAEDEA